MTTLARSTRLRALVLGAIICWLAHPRMGTAASAANPPSLNTQQPALSALMPANAVAYAEMPRPSQAVADIAQGHLRAHLVNSPLWPVIAADAKLAAVLQLAGSWKPPGANLPAALQGLMGGGLAMALVPATKPGKSDPDVVIVMRGDSAQGLRAGLESVLKILPGAASLIPIPTPENVNVVSLGEANYAVVDSLLVLANRRDLAEGVVKRALSLKTPGVAGPATAGDSPAAQSLAAAKTLRQAAALCQTHTATLWGFVDLRAVAAAAGKARLLPDRADNILAALLVGGHAEALAMADVLVAEVALTPASLTASVGVPVSGQQLPATHAGLLAGPAMATGELRPQGTWLSWTLRRDMAALWANRERLVVPHELAGLAELDNFMTASFGGRDFGQEVLPTLRPHMRLIATTPRLADNQPRPAIQLPAAALFLECRSPDEALAWRRAFKRLIGVVSYILGESTKGDLDLDRETHRGQPVWYIAFDEAAPPAGGVVPITANFSPAAVVLGSGFVLTSHRALARELIDLHLDGRAADRHTADRHTADALTVEARTLAGVLAINRQALIDHNIATKGQTAQQAGDEVSALVMIVEWFAAAELATHTAADATHLRLRIDWTRPAASPLPR